jgi:hypothetical protein
MSGLPSFMAVLGVLGLTALVSSEFFIVTAATVWSAETLAGAPPIVVKTSLALVCVISAIFAVMAYRHIARREAANRITATLEPLTSLEGEADTASD